MDEYFLHPLSPTQAARIPFPNDLPLAKRDTYMAKPPADAIAKAERVTITPPPAPAPTPAPTTPTED